MKQPEQKITTNKSFLKVLSFGMAVLCWLLVTMLQKPEQDRSVTKVPVDVGLQTAALDALSLNVVEINLQTVTAVVNGERGIIGRIPPEAVTATVKIDARITGPGTYTLDLIPASTDDRYTLVRYSPSTVNVTFDREETRILAIEPVVNGLAIAPGYIQGVSGIRVTPEQITVRGPQREVERIHECIVQVDLKEPLNQAYVASDLPIRFLDAQGDELDLGALHLKLEPDRAQLVIPILQTKTLPLVFGFTNVPDSLPDPLEYLSYQMSDYDVTIAGPVEQVSRYQEIQVGHIDLRTLTIEQSEIEFSVTMPGDSIVNRSDVQSTTVTFDTSEWETMTVAATQIELLNMPTDKIITLLDDRVGGIQLTGERTAIEGLTAADVVVQVDLSERELPTGQHYYPVKISVPVEGPVWANGEYSVLLLVEDAE